MTDEAVADKEPSAGTKSRIQVEKIRFTWPGTLVPILTDFSMTVGEGERVFVQGASGSGKSTLLGLLAGINAAQAGRIQLLGQDLSAMSGAERDRFRADHIGYIFQQFNLLPYLSVLENVTLPCFLSNHRTETLDKRHTSAKVEARRLLAAIGLDGFEDSPVTKLSVGQQQRVAAARAVIGAPEILIADEPTSALDADHRHRFLQLLFELCSDQGACLVFVSHDRELGSEFDRVLEVGV